MTYPRRNFVKELRGAFAFNKLGTRFLEGTRERKQLEERNKTVAQNREARAQIPNSSTPSENKGDVPTQANTSTAELRSSLENSLTPTSLEASIIKSEEVIRAIPDKKIQASMRAINASILFDVFRQA